MERNALPRDYPSLKHKDFEKKMSHAAEQPTTHGVKYPATYEDVSRAPENGTGTASGEATIGAGSCRLATPANAGVSRRALFRIVPGLGVRGAVAFHRPHGSRIENAIVCPVRRWASMADRSKVANPGGVRVTERQVVFRGAFEGNDAVAAAPFDDSRFDLGALWP